MKTMEKQHNELTSAYDVIGRSWKGEVIFTAETEKGKAWILKKWNAVEFRTSGIERAAIYIQKMNYDGLEVALLCGV